jgi:hypothetical protein
MKSGVLRVDAGKAGVWALGTLGQVFYRAGTYGDSGTSGTDWKQIPGPANAGTLASVSSGKHVVAVADGSGRVWLRMGVGPDTPGGVAWLRLAGVLTQVEVYETDTVIALWGCQTSQAVFFKVLYK